MFVSVIDAADARVIEPFSELFLLLDPMGCSRDSSAPRLLGRMDAMVAANEQRL